MNSFFNKKASFLYLALIFVFVFLFPFPSGGNKFVWKHIFDAGHFALFFLLCLGIYLWLETREKSRGAILKALGVASLVAVAIEVIQPFTGRSASFVDIFNGVLGALCASYALAVFERQGVFRAVLKALVPSIAAQAVVLLPAFQAFSALQWRDAQFPQLGVFESAEALSVWRPMNSKNNPTPAERALIRMPALGNQSALRLQTFKDTWSGVYYDGGAQDWSQFSTLVIRAFNPSQMPLEVSLRIDDTGDCKKFRNRFNRSIQLLPGIAEYRVALDDIREGPETRELNLEQIRFVYIFRDKSAPSSLFALQRVFLE